MPFAKRILEYNRSTYLDKNTDHLVPSEDILGLQNLCLTLAALVQHADNLWDELLTEILSIHNRTQDIQTCLDHLTIVVNGLNARDVKIPVGSLTGSEACRFISDDHEIISTSNGAGSNIPDSSLHRSVDRDSCIKNHFTENSRPACLREIHRAADANAVKSIRQCWEGSRAAGSEEGREGFREDDADGFICGPHVYLQEFTVGSPFREEELIQRKISHGTDFSFQSPTHRPLREPKISQSNLHVTSSLQEIPASPEVLDSSSLSQSQPSIVILVNTSSRSYLEHSSFNRSLSRVHEQTLEYVPRRGSTKHRGHSEGDLRSSGTAQAATDLIKKTPSRDRWEKAYSGEGFLAENGNVNTPRAAKLRSRRRKKNEHNLITCSWRKSFCLPVKSSKENLREEEGVWIETRPRIESVTSARRASSSERCKSLPRSFKTSAKQTVTSDSIAVDSRTFSKQKSKCNKEDISAVEVHAEVTANGEKENEEVHPAVKVSKNKDKKLIQKVSGDAKSSVQIKEELKAEKTSNDKGSDTVSTPKSDEIMLTEEFVKIPAAKGTQHTDDSPVTPHTVSNTNKSTLSKKSESPVQSESPAVTRRPEAVCSSPWRLIHGDEVISINSVDQDGFYTTMHTDSGFNNRTSFLSPDLDLFDNLSFASFASTDLGFHDSPLFPRNIDSRLSNVLEGITGGQSMDSRSPSLSVVRDLKHKDSPGNVRANKYKGRIGRKVSFDKISGSSCDGSISEAAIAKITTTANTNAPGFMSLCVITPDITDDEDDVFSDHSIVRNQLSQQDTNGAKFKNFLPYSTNDSVVSATKLNVKSNDFCKIEPSKIITKNKCDKPSLFSDNKLTEGEKISASKATDDFTSNSGEKTSSLGRKSVGHGEYSENKLSTWPGSETKSPIEKNNSEVLVEPLNYEYPNQSHWPKLPPSSVNFQEIQQTNAAEPLEPIQTKDKDTESSQTADKVVSSFKSFTSDRWRQTLMKESNSDGEKVAMKYRPVIVVRPKQREVEVVKQECEPIDLEALKISADVDVVKSNIVKTDNVMLPVSARLVISSPVTKQGEYCRNPNRRSVCSPVSPEDLKKLQLTDEMNPEIISSSISDNHRPSNLQNFSTNGVSFSADSSGINMRYNQNISMTLKPDNTSSLPREASKTFECISLHPRVASSCNSSLERSAAYGSFKHRETRSDARTDCKSNQAQMAFLGANSNAAISGLAAEQRKKNVGLKPQSPTFGTVHNKNQEKSTRIYQIVNPSHSTVIARTSQKTSTLESDSSGVGSSVSSSPLTSPSNDSVPYSSRGLVIESPHGLKLMNKDGSLLPTFDVASDVDDKGKTKTVQISSSSYQSTV